MFRTRKEREAPSRHNGAHSLFNNPPDELSSFLDELSDFIDSTEGDAQAIKAELNRRVHRARGHARSLIRAAQDAGSALGDRAADSMHRGLDRSRDMVHERPLSAIALTAIGGLLLGMLLSSRR
ncbi:MAG TPA: hypothetical protein PKA20_24890 [Burkholderiaceae bacterium]|nr:hypothetical protein [Burkholderiaceae bacterium]